MKKIALMLLLIPAIANADVIPTRTLEPVVRVAEDKIYVSDKKGNDWAVVTNCRINPREVKEFTIRSRTMQQGTTIKLSEEMHCEVQSISLV